MAVVVSVVVMLALASSADARQVSVSLGFAPSTLGVAANIFKVVKGARGNPDFSGRRYQDSVSRSLMSESMEKSSTNSPFLA